MSCCKGYKVTKLGIPSSLKEWFPNSQHHLVNLVLSFLQYHLAQSPPPTTIP